MSSGDLFRVKGGIRKLRSRQWLAEEAMQKATEMENCSFNFPEKVRSTDKYLLLGSFFQIKQEVYSL